MGYRSRATQANYGLQRDALVKHGLQIEGYTGKVWATQVNMDYRGLHNTKHGLDRQSIEYSDCSKLKVVWK